MIDRIKALVLGAPGQTDGAAGNDSADADAAQVAAVALLIEAAVMDGDFDQTERHTIARLLAERFGLDAGAIEDLIAAGEDAVEHSHQLFAFTRVVKQGFDFDERIKMIEMLWEVVYADGVLHDYEANLMRRIGGLVYVTDQERGAARKRVLARLNTAG